MVNGTEQMNFLFYLISATLKRHMWLLVAVAVSALLYSDVSYIVISGLGVPTLPSTVHLPLILHVILVPSQKNATPWDSTLSP